jgi:transcription termination/antitermination protein NusG
MTMPEAPKKHYYVIRVYTSQEATVKTYIEQEVKRLEMQDRIGDVLIPMETIVEMREGKKRIKNKVFFPGYLLVEMVLDEKTRHLITNSPCFLGFAGNVQDPQPLRPEEVDRILGRVEEKRGTMTVDIPFQVDDKVKINDGPFKDFIGSIKEINQEKRKLKVLVSIFGRSTPVEVDFLQVTTNIST